MHGIKRWLLLLFYWIDFDPFFIFHCPLWIPQCYSNPVLYRWSTLLHLCKIKYILYCVAECVLYHTPSRLLVFTSLRPGLNLVTLPLSLWKDVLFKDIKIKQLSSTKVNLHWCLCIHCHSVYLFVFICVCFTGISWLIQGYSLTSF